MKDTPPVLLRGVQRLVQLYSGDEKNLGFAEDVARLKSHIEDFEDEKPIRWDFVEQIAHGIGHMTVARAGRPLSEDGIRGIKQLVCKVWPQRLLTDLP